MPDAGGAGGGPCGPPPVGGAAHLGHAGLRHRVFLWLLPGVCLLPERRHQPPGLWTAHLPGAAACHLLRAHRPGGPQHQPGQSHSLRPRGGPAAGPAFAGAGGVELRRLRPGGHPAGPGGENPDLPARPEVCHAGVRGAVFRRGGLPGGGPGGHPGDVPPDRPLRVSGRPVKTGCYHPAPAPSREIGRGQAGDGLLMLPFKEFAVP